MAVEYYAIKVCDYCEEEVERIDLRYRDSHLEFPEEEGWQSPSEDALCKSCESEKAEAEEIEKALEKRHGDEGAVFTTRTFECKDCDAQYEIEYEESDYASWQAGELYVQDAFPYLQAWERELMCSRTCPECWQNMYPE